MPVGIRHSRRVCTRRASGRRTCRTLLLLLAFAFATLSGCHCGGSGLDCPCDFGPTSEPCTVECNGSCVRFPFNTTANCGSCGHSCGSGQVCWFETCTSPPYSLTVAKSGSGDGTVTGPGIDCGSTCYLAFSSPTSITLTATAASGSYFVGWSGCDSSSGSSCTVYVYMRNTVTADFVSPPPPWVVSTLAGMAGMSGSADGTGAAARFFYPAGVAVDGSGNVYVADTSNYTVRKVTPAGVVSTLAGTAGSPGSLDGTGAAARFNVPRGVAVDGSGNVYVTDANSHTLRKVTPEGVVTTLAGTYGNSGSADGTGAAAQFYFPAGVAVDGSGNVYVADSYNNTIRKVTPAGVVTTVAGTAGNSGSADGTGAAARFNRPSGVAVDGSGNVYVADTNNNTIRKVTPAGVVTTVAGTAGISGSADGTGAAARLYYPAGVAVDGSGNVYVADTENDTIRKLTPAGVVTTVAGTAGIPGSADGPGAAARFGGPTSVAVDGSGNIYVADSGNFTIRKITPVGG